MGKNSIDNWQPRKVLKYYMIYAGYRDDQHATNKKEC